MYLRGLNCREVGIQWPWTAKLSYLYSPTRSVCTPKSLVNCILLHRIYAFGHFLVWEYTLELLSVYMFSSFKHILYAYLYKITRHKIIISTVTVIIFFITYSLFFCSLFIGILFLYFIFLHP